MTVYVFDKDRTVRMALSPNQLTDLIHDENNNKITASISSEAKIQNGEHIGFRCVDGYQ